MAKKKDPNEETDTHPRFEMTEIFEPPLEQDARTRRTSRLRRVPVLDDPISCALVVVKGQRIGEKLEFDSRKNVVGRDPDCDLVIGTADDGTSRRHATFSQTERGLVIEDLGSTNGVFVDRRPCDRQLLAPGSLVQVGSTVFKVIGDGEELEYHDTVFELTVRDPLTGLYNRLFLRDSLPNEISRSRRYMRPLSMILVDLDHFKAVNDRCGHVAGDAVLVAVAERMSQTLRTTDLSFRYGGEEFLVLLPETSLDVACSVAERCRQAVADLRPPEIPIEVTASFGVAEIGPEETPLQWVTRADQALYRAKARGRNRVESGAV